LGLLAFAHCSAPRRPGACAARRGFRPELRPQNHARWLTEATTTVKNKTGNTAVYRKRNKAALGTAGRFAGGFGGSKEKAPLDGGAELTRDFERGGAYWRAWRN